MELRTAVVRTTARRSDCHRRHRCGSCCRCRIGAASITVARATQEIVRTRTTDAAVRDDGARFDAAPSRCFAAFAAAAKAVRNARKVAVVARIAVLVAVVATPTALGAVLPRFLLVVAQAIAAPRVRKVRRTVWTRKATLDGLFHLHCVVATATETQTTALVRDGRVQKLGHIFDF